MPPEVIAKCVFFNRQVNFFTHPDKCPCFYCPFFMCQNHLAKPKMPTKALKALTKSAIWVSCSLKFHKLFQLISGNPALFPLAQHFA